MSSEYKSFFHDYVGFLHDPIYNFLANNGGLDATVETNNALFHQSADSILGSWVVCILLIVAALIARSKLNAIMSKSGLEKYQADTGFSPRNAFEMYTQFIYKTLTDNLSKKDARLYFWFFGGVFVYIFFSNLIGVLPGGAPPTQNFSNNLTISLTVLILFVGIGVKEQGIGYFTHMAGPILWLAPLMFVIEMFGAIIVRPASLAVRLTGNMNGDHAVLGVAYDLSSSIGGYGLPVAALCLGAFVALIQAFVFTLLSVVYVALSVGHGDEHH